MKNNSCTVVLNGHGCYSSNANPIDISQSDYNIVFTCAMKSAASNTSHNYLLYLLSEDVNLSWQMLEFSKSTRVANKYAKRSFIVDMDAKHTSIIYDHGLCNAENVVDVNTLVDVDHTRFVSYVLQVNRAEWR